MTTGFEIWYAVTVLYFCTLIFVKSFVTIPRINICIFAAVPLLLLFLGLLWILDKVISNNMCPWKLSNEHVQYTKSLYIRCAMSNFYGTEIEI